MHDHLWRIEARASLQRGRARKKGVVPIFWINRKDLLPSPLRTCKLHNLPVYFCVFVRTEPQSLHIVLNRGLVSEQCMISKVISLSYLKYGTQKYSNVRKWSFFLKFHLLKQIPGKFDLTIIADTNSHTWYVWLSHVSQKALYASQANTSKVSLEACTVPFTIKTVLLFSSPSIIYIVIHQIHEFLIS